MTNSPKPGPAKSRAMATEPSETSYSTMINWPEIDTVFLDMDGTLLDLYFDNYFWQVHVPLRYSQKNGISEQASRAELVPKFASMTGTMQWYCVDYWSAELALDIAALKREVAHLIAVHPHVQPFLESLRASGKHVVLLTNAHHKSIDLKMQHTGLERYFDTIFSAHRIGSPKESERFWTELEQLQHFVPQRTLLIDDSLPVLRAARDYGLGHLLAIRKPDSRVGEKHTDEFKAPDSFLDIMPKY